MWPEPPHLWEHSHSGVRGPIAPSPPSRDASEHPCFRDATDAAPARLFLGGSCSCFVLLLVSASCLPLPLRSPGMSLPLLQMPRVRALGPSVLHCMSSGISVDIESTLNYAHQGCPPGLGKCYCFFAWCPQLFPSWKGAHRR